MVEIVTEEGKDNTAVVDPRVEDRFRIITQTINGHVGRLNTAPGTRALTAPDPASFYCFGFNPVDIKTAPTKENVAYVVVSSNHRRRKRLAGAGAALWSEIRSRQNIRFTTDDAWGSRSLGT